MAEGEREMESLGRDFEGLARASNAILESAGAIVGCAESDRMASVLPGVQKLGSAAKGFIRTRLEATAGILDTVIAEQALLQQLSHLTRGQKAIVRETEMLRVLTNIEVARLGEVGAGFEYLAHELDDFSQSVTRSTQELTSHTEERREAIGETRRALGIQRTAELVQEITAASKEQDTGSEQINKALQQLEQVIQQNASASEEMASTTEELTGQSDQLVSALSFFRTGRDGRLSAVAAAAIEPSSHVEAEPAKAIKSNGHSVSSGQFEAGLARVARPNGRANGAGAKLNGKGGVALRLKDKHDDLDGEFERY
jgi:methyl-accepting chemotaxis protein